MPSLDHGEDSLSHSMTWKIGHFDNIADYVCDSYNRAAAKASSAFTKFTFRGFCPNKISALEKQAENKLWRVKHSAEANLATGECEPGVYMQD